MTVAPARGRELPAEAAEPAAEAAAEAAPDRSSTVAPIPRRLGHRIAHGILRPVIGVCFLLLFALRVWHVRRAGRERSYILLANHQSYIDPLFLGAVSPQPLHFMARANLFRPGLGTLIRRLGAYPVTRGRRDEGALRHTQGLLAAGNAVLIFGEGTRTADGEIQAIRGGVEIISRRTQAAVVPMALDGLFQMAPRNRSMRYLKPRGVHIVVGEPLRPATYLGWPARGLPERLRPRFQELLVEARARRESAERAGLLTLSRPAVEALAAYYRLLHGLLRLVRPGRRTEAAKTS